MMTPTKAASVFLLWMLGSISWAFRNYKTYYVIEPLNNALMAFVVIMGITVWMVKKEPEYKRNDFVRLVVFGSGIALSVFFLIDGIFFALSSITNWGGHDLDILAYKKQVWDDNLGIAIGISLLIGLILFFFLATYITKRRA